MRPLLNGWWLCARILCAGAVERIVTAVVGRPSHDTDFGRRPKPDQFLTRREEAAVLAAYLRSRADDGEWIAPEGARAIASFLDGERAR